MIHTGARSIAPTNFNSVRMKIEVKQQNNQFELVDCFGDATIVRAAMEIGQSCIGELLASLSQAQLCQTFMHVLGDENIQSTLAALTTP